MFRVHRVAAMMLVIAILLWSTGAAAFATPAAERQVVFVVDCLTYVVDGASARADAAPFIREGRTFVPVRFLAYALGVSEEGIIWDAATQTVTLTMGAVSMRLRIGSPFIVVNDVPREMDVTPLIVPPGRIALPARFVAEAFGFEVGWDPPHRAVLIGPRGRLPGVPPLLAVSPAAVMRVVDADTIEVVMPGGQLEIVQLAGVTGPQPVSPPEPLALEAATYVSELLPPGTVVYLELVSADGRRDRLGRLPAHVWLTRPFDGGETEVREQMLSARLLFEGYAWPSGEGTGPYAAALETLAQDARTAQRGLWQHLGVSPVTATSADPADRRLLAIREVIELVQPAVVSVRTHRAEGSGFFVSSDGRVLTNAHVVRGSRWITVVTLEGRQFPASIRKIDNHSDLAILSLDVPPQLRFSIIRHLRYLSGVAVGDEVLAFGDPLGLDRTVTRGIVGAMREMSPSLGAWIPDIVCIQHDAAIAGGSSGGPLVNLRGEWIGVNTLEIRGENLGFAVPADHYYWLLQEADYGLQDDWFSYYTEEYFWRSGERQQVMSLIDQAMRAGWGPIMTDRLMRALDQLSSLRTRVASYHARYPEIQELVNLYSRSLEATSAYAVFLLTVSLEPLAWSQTTHDSLWQAETAALAAYDAARQRVADHLDLRPGGP